MRKTLNLMTLIGRLIPKQRNPSNRYLRTTLTACAIRVPLVSGSTGNRLRAFSGERTDNQLYKLVYVKNWYLSTKMIRHIAPVCP